jgi:hypothetical protein
VEIINQIDVIHNREDMELIENYQEAVKEFVRRARENYEAVK